MSTMCILVGMLLILKCYYVTGETFSLSGSAPYVIKGEDYTFTCQMSGKNVDLNVYFLQTACTISCPQDSSTAVFCYVKTSCRTSSSSDRYTCGCINNNKRHLYFNITNIQSTDAGTWKCGKFDINGGNSPPVTLPVYYGPENIRFTPTSSNKTVIENETVTCSADCNPPCNTISWYKDSTIISSTERLSLNNITRQQAGNYTCQVTNTQIPDSLQSKQLVYYKPTITSLTSNATNNMIDEDSIVTLTCSVDSLPSSVISWSRSQQGEQLYIGSQYTIPKASSQHTDNYSCTASNNIDQPVSKTIPLYVRYVPVLDPKKETKTRISVGRGETGVLSIHVLAYPLPVYTWYYQRQDGSKQLVTDLRFRQEDTGLSSTLTIQDVTEDDGGKYIVYINNSLGTRSILFNLDVTSQDDRGQFVNYVIIVGLATGLGTCLLILCILLLKRSGKNICLRNKTAGDQTVSHKTTNQGLDNINLSDTPHVYGQVSEINIRGVNPVSTDENLDIESGDEAIYDDLDEHAIDQEDNNSASLKTGDQTVNNDATIPGGYLTATLKVPNEYLVLIDTDEDLEEQDIEQQDNNSVSLKTGDQTVNNDKI